MITFEWYLLIYILVNAVVFIWAITIDDYDDFLGSDRTWALCAFILCLLFTTLFYGGMFLW